MNDPDVSSTFVENIEISDSTLVPPSGRRDDSTRRRPTPPNSDGDLRRQTEAGCGSRPFLRSGVQQADSILAAPANGDTGREALGVSWEDATSHFRSHSPTDFNSQERQAAALNMRRLRSEYHNRPRCTLDKPPLLISAPLLDQPAWLQPLCYWPLFFPCCLNHEYLASYRKSEGSNLQNTFHADLAMGDVSELGEVNTHYLQATSEHVLRRRRYVGGQAAISVDSPSDGGSAAETYNRGWSQVVHTLFRCFCIRCIVAQQTTLLFQEERARQRYPYRFCCEDFFGSEGNYHRTLWSMILCDILTAGLPCGCWYHGMGTACFGWRIRYLIRCRYRVQGVTIFDLLRMMCIPMQCVDQQGTQMGVNGLREQMTICAPVCMN